MKIKKIKDIKRPLSWKLINLWYIPVGLVFWPFFPLTLLYTGIMGKKKLWINLSIFLLIVFGVSTFMILSQIMAMLFSIIIGVAFFAQIVYVILSAKEYLNRLDINQRESVAFQDVKDRIGNDPALAQNKLGNKFVMNLQK